MEMALDNVCPSLRGVFGVLGEYTLLSAVLIRFPMLAVFLLYLKGYFSQRLAEDGSQTEEPVVWRVEDFLIEEAARVTVPLENRLIDLRALRYSVKVVLCF